MLATAILALLATPALAAKTPTKISRRLGQSIERDQTPVIEIFSWNAIADYTGVTPSSYLPAPAAGSPESLACTPRPGPDPLGCPSSIDVWGSLVDSSGQISIAAGQCQAVTLDCCQTVVCAPLSDISVAPTDVTGRMWNPLTIKCVQGGTGGVWQSEGSTLFIQMDRPQDDTCST